MDLKNFIADQTNGAKVKIQKIPHGVILHATLVKGAYRAKSGEFAYLDTQHGPLTVSEINDYKIVTDVK